MQYVYNEDKKGAFIFQTNPLRIKLRQKPLELASVREKVLKPSKEASSWLALSIAEGGKRTDDSLAEGE